MNTSCGRQDGLIVERQRYHYIYILIALCLFSCVDTKAQQQTAGKIFLKDQTLTPLPNAASWINAAKMRTTGMAAPEEVLIQFYTTPDAIKKELLRTNGVLLLRYIPDNTFACLLTKPLTEQIVSATGIRSITRMESQWKTDTRIAAGQQKGAVGNVNVLVSFNGVVSPDEIRGAIAQNGGSITKDGLEQLGIYKISMPFGNISLLAAWYGTEYISPDTEPVALNFESRTAAKGNVATAPTFAGGYGLTGEGVTVGVGDNVAGNFHIDLKDRIINYNPAAYTNHGVHINGIVGAAGIIDPKGQGMATHAMLLDHYYSEVWEQTPAMFESHNMTLTNNSYAANVGDCRASGIYDVNALAVDKMALQYREVLHVFASGNDGKMNCSPYPAGFGTVTGGFQPAKNNIVVTSTDKQYVNAVDGSRGPVRDGRLKPEITAVGVDVLSTTRAEEYLVAGGTSMATPGVTGGLALLTERYRQLYGPVNPRAEVLKAILLNGATDIGNPGPDYRFGFGFMNLIRSLSILNEGRFKANTIPNGNDEQTITVDVPFGTDKLNVMLCWYDVPGSPAAAVQLINDLDLEVVTPTATVHKPLVLDPTPANILNNATEQADHLNNTEQVTINAPQPGTYTIKVKGFNLPEGAQDYIVSYDFVPSGIALTYPAANAEVKAGDRLLIYWDASSNNNVFSLEYSLDNGNNWLSIDNNIASERRYYQWMVPADISSGQCQMRLTRLNTGETSISGIFTINKQPIVRLSASQCPGYINIEWDSVGNATAYEILKKTGANMVAVDTVSGRTYSFSGLSLDSFYYAALRPMLSGRGGYRSLGIKRRPNDGDCANPASNGDLMVESIVSPVSGRKFTTSELSANETLVLRLRNMDDVPQNYYRISYSINNGAWRSEIVNTPIPENNKLEISLEGVDFSATGTYTIRAAIENYLMPDPEHKNDTVKRIIRHLKNDPIDLATAFNDGFEATEILTTIIDSAGFTPNDHWDFVSNSDTGRLRTRANTGLLINGNRSVSMDAVKYTPTSSQNELTGTFNLSNYDLKETEVRVDFKYLLHGQPSQAKGNDVWVRGSDTSQWQKLFNYGTNILNIGTVQQSGSLSLNDALVRGFQKFTPATQIRFGQNDISSIGNRNFGRGLTLDDVRIYTVQNDIQLTKVLAPNIISCGLPAASPLTVEVYNSVSQPQTNVQIYYRLNNGETVAETIPAIKGKETINYTFNKQVNTADFQVYKLDIWLVASGDTYRDNDSIINYTFRNQPRVVSYPYKEDFESGDGGWYENGLNSSWEYGTPASEKINKAASGTKAWKTNLDGNYNDKEASYLNGPCFDLSQMESPMLRFKIAYDIENCGIVYCDASAMEYSLDGTNWERLGTWKDGINWYNDTMYNVWSMQDNTMWHEASIALPKLKYDIRLRYLFTSDPGGNYEGIAIDDIEIYDRKISLPNPQLISVSPNPNRDGNIKIAWNAYNGTEMKIAITDISGRQVFTTVTRSTTDAYNETMIHTPIFQSGMYFMRIIIGDSKYTQKIIYTR